MQKRVCMIENCEEPIVGRGMCRRHWGAWHKTGDVRAPMRGSRKMSDQERFERFVARMPNGCWAWSGSMDAKGHGLFRFGGTSTRAERASLILHRGPVEGVVGHECGYSNCVNPEHLIAGSSDELQSELTKRGWADRGKSKILHVPEPESPTICAVKECERPLKGQGFCERHLARLEKTGTLVPGEKLRHGWDIKERLYAQRKIRGECWLWTGYRDKNGYGKMRVVGYDAQQLVHRMSWRAHNGEIPENVFVLHSCDTPPCFNPSHLFLGNHGTNHDDMVSKGRGWWQTGNTSSAHPGEENPMSKLTEKDVLEIRAEPNKRGVGARLAREYSVSTETISAIRRRRIWTHLTP